MHIFVKLVICGLSSFRSNALSRMLHDANPRFVIQEPLDHIKAFEVINLHCFGERKGEKHQCEEKKHQLFASSRCLDWEFLPSVYTQPGDDRPLDWGSHVPAHGMGTKPQHRHMP